MAVVPPTSFILVVLLVERLVGNPVMAIIAGDGSLIALLGFEPSWIVLVCLWPMKHQVICMHKIHIITINYICILLYIYTHILCTLKSF